MAKKHIRYDWVRLQKEFDLYKLKNREKTLKEFCEFKGLSYNHACIKLKVKKAKEKAKVYDEQKSASFIEAVKKKPQLKVKKKR